MITLSRMEKQIPSSARDDTLGTSRAPSSRGSAATEGSALRAVVRVFSVFVCALFARQVAAQTSPKLYITNQVGASITVVDQTKLAIDTVIDLTALGFSKNAKPHHAIVEPDGMRIRSANETIALRAGGAALPQCAESVDAFESAGGNERAQHCQ